MHRTKGQKEIVRVAFSRRRWRSMMTVAGWNCCWCIVHVDDDKDDDNEQPGEWGGREEIE